MPPPAPAGGAAAQGAVSALVWAPSGDALAVGTERGWVRVVRVNPAGGAGWNGKGERVRGNVRVGAGVTALQWVAGRGEVPPAYEARDRSEEEGGGGGFVVVGDAGGGVSVLSFDLSFRVAEFAAFGRAVAVTKVFMLEDLSCVFAAGEGEGSVKLCRVSLDSVLGCRAELMRAGAEAVAMRGTLEKLKGCCTTIGEAWVKEGMEALSEAIIAPLDKLRWDCAEDSTVGAWRLLYNAFCGGGASGALEQFLGKELSESGAKEALRSFTASSKDAREALAHALPLAERVAFRSSEYRGLARCCKRFRDIGVTVKDVDRVFEAVEAVLGLLGVLQEVMEEANVQTCAFLKWITGAAAQADGNDTAQQGSGGDEELQTSLRRSAR